MISLVKHEVGARLVAAAEFLQEVIKENISVLPDTTIVEAPNAAKYPLNPNAIHVWGYPASDEGEYPQIASGDLQCSIKVAFDHDTLTAAVGVDPTEPKFAHEADYWRELELVTDRGFMLRSVVECLPQLVGVLISDPAHASP